MMSRAGTENRNSVNESLNISYINNCKGAPYMTNNSKIDLINL